MATSAPPPIPDVRTPGAALPCISLRMPDSALGRLQAQADRLHTSRGALARALLLCGLDTLEQQAATEEVA